MDLYSKVALFRSKFIAPVDTTGCQAHQQDRFLVLISLILRSRTKDEVVFKIVEQIKDKLKPSILSLMKEEEILELIKGVNFANAKAKYLRETSIIINNQYTGEVPSDPKLLAKLPGVGPKTVELFKSTVDGDTTTLSVDTHMDRIFRRWNWVDAKTPEKTMVEMKKWFPEIYRKDVHQIVAGFGQIICSATPKCNMCPINMQCPSSLFKGKQVDIEDIKIGNLNVTWTIPDEKGEPIKLVTKW
jgi:endonuclease-3